MLTSYPVACPHESCGWTGSLAPSSVQGGAREVIASRQRAWFQCPRCQKDWEVRITNDKVTILPAVANERLNDQAEDRWQDEGGQGIERRKQGKL